MRVLFCTSIGASHIFPIIPLAWALRVDGHEVLVATTRNYAGIVSSAGLYAVAIASDVDFASLLTPLADSYYSGSPNGSASGSAGRRPSRVSLIADALTDALVHVAEAWRPDIIIHEPHQPGGAIAAARLGVPSVEHGWSISHMRTAVDWFTEMSNVLSRHGISTPPAVCAGIDVAPPSMRTGKTLGWPMRYVPYNGGVVVPPWLWEQRTPRVAVTLGTYVPVLRGIEAIRWIVEEAAASDLEVVLALGKIDMQTFGNLPPNVRVSGWLPLHALLPTCRAIVHHAGAGSMMAALQAGVPQIALPQGADQFFHADAIVQRGVGIAATSSNGGDALRTVLGDERFVAAAREVRSEIRSMPPPSDIVAKLVSLATGDVTTPVAQRLTTEG
ncbi:MAG: DUF1205 domain-containing protein [Acidobacteriota bacterium]|nr:DUF1205 domain-containing protein [Acidobacteriota bacterium]